MNGGGGILTLWLLTRQLIVFQFAVIVSRFQVFGKSYPPPTLYPQIVLELTSWLYLWNADEFSRKQFSH